MQIRLDRVKVITEMARCYMTVNELAERVGVARGTITNIRSGKTCSPQVAEKIAKVFGCTVDELFEKQE